MIVRTVADWLRTEKYRGITLLHAPVFPELLLSESELLGFLEMSAIRIDPNLTDIAKIFGYEDDEDGTIYK